MDRDSFEQKFIKSYSDSIRKIHSFQGTDPTSTFSNENTQNLINNEADKMRTQYLELFKIQENFDGEGTNPGWWKTTFRGISVTLVDELYKTSNKEEKTNQETKVAFMEFEKITLSSEKYSCILVGKRRDCDLVINSNSISRLHAVIYFFKEKRKIVVVDVGSFFGIKMSSRSSTKKLINSLPKDRKVIELEWGEKVSLLLGGNVVRFY